MGANDEDLKELSGHTCDCVIVANIAYARERRVECENMVKRSLPHFATLSPQSPALLLCTNDRLLSQAWCAMIVKTVGSTTTVLAIIRTKLLTTISNFVQHLKHTSSVHSYMVLILESWGA